MKRSIIAAGFSLLCWLAVPPSAHAGPPPADTTVHRGYLAGRDIGYVSPPAPDNGDRLSLPDLDAVRAAQGESPDRRNEAFEDAYAYSYDLLMARFSAAAGTHLSPAGNPVLAHVLQRVLIDLGGDARRDPLSVNGYVTVAKLQHGGSRARPYIEDPAIIPCETDYLRATDMQSYPSGHAANGYAAALVLSAIMPERRTALVARGIRYGDNRVVCGVHHPGDVAEGRRIAAAYVAALGHDEAFRHDLECAQDEYRAYLNAAAGPRPDWKERCAALRTAP